MPNIIYEREVGRRKYVSIEKHRSVAHNRHSKWLSINIEKDLFDDADYGNYEKNVEKDNSGWLCASGNLWALQNDKSSVGDKNQQFGYFQKPGYPDGEWHGFPIVPFSQKRYCISSDLLSKWTDQGVISVDDISAIMKKRRI